MTAHEQFSSANRRCAALLFIAFIFVVFYQQDVVAQPSAAEILAASKVAMSKPLKYRVVTADIDMVVYQKALPNGSLASLSEITSPIKKIKITYGEKSYELYLEYRVAIDTQFMHQAAKSQADAISSTLGSKAKESAKVIGTVKRDGKECFEIESILSLEFVAALAKTAPPEAKNRMPAKFRHVIEKLTFLMVGMQIISRDGSLLSSSEFKDIQPQRDLPDELFLLPAGLEVKRPKSMKDYMSLLIDMLSPSSTFRPKDPPLLSLPDPKSLALLDDSAELIEPESKDKSSTRTIGFAIPSLSLFALSAVFVLFRSRKS